MRGICWLAESRLASQEGLCCMALAGTAEQIPLRFAQGAVLFGNNCSSCSDARLHAVLTAYWQIASNEWYQATHITKKLVSRNWFNSAWNYVCKKLSLFFPTYIRGNPYTGFQATAVSYLKYQRTQFAVFISGIKAVVSWNCSCMVHATTAWTPCMKPANCVRWFLKETTGLAWNPQYGFDVS